MFREAVIWEFALWGDGRITIGLWLVTERRCGVRIKQLMWRMARLTYGTRYAVVMWCQSKQNWEFSHFWVGRVWGLLSRVVAPTLLTLLHCTPSSAQSPALLRFCYSTWFWSCIEYTGCLLQLCEFLSFWVVCIGFLRHHSSVVFGWLCFSLKLGLFVLSLISGI